jgi:hypothetical protein
MQGLHVRAEKEKESGKKEKKNESGRKKEGEGAFLI